MRPSNTRIVVDLPDPLGPTNPTTPPLGTSNVRLSEDCALLLEGERDCDRRALSKRGNRVYLTLVGCDDALCDRQAEA